MTYNSNLNQKITIIAIVVGVFAIFATIVVFTRVFAPPPLAAPSAAIQVDSTPANDFLPEVIPLLTYTAAPTQTATSAPTNEPFPTRTPYVLPTLAFGSQPLPDLTVTRISDPVCVPEADGTILEFTIFVRNIGLARTRNYGAFDVDVYLILGQRRYGLDEWAEKFDGVVGSSITQVYDLRPGEDIKFTVVIDLKGNKDFGIEAIVNSGEKPIREADVTNNRQIDYYSLYCN